MGGRSQAHRDRVAARKAAELELASKDLAAPDIDEVRVFASSSRELTEYEKRVRHVAQMMQDGIWYGGSSRLSLRIKWECSDSAMKHIAAEAHRLVAMTPEDREALRTTTVNRFQQIAARAQSNVNMITGQADLASEIKAIELAAKYAGVEADIPRAEIDRSPIQVNLVLTPEIDPSDSAESPSESSAVTRDS